MPHHPPDGGHAVPDPVAGNPRPRIVGPLPLSPEARKQVRELPWGQPPPGDFPRVENRHALAGPRLFHGEARAAWNGSRGRASRAGAGEYSRMFSPRSYARRLPRGAMGSERRPASFSERPPRVSAVLPARDEEATIGPCIERLRSALPGVEVVVVDSSSDSTPEVARRLGAAVLPAGGPGYGRACVEGLRAARGEFLLLGDADGTYDFSEAPRLLEALERADLALGNRFLGGLRPGAMSPLHRLGNALLSRTCRRVTGLPLGDAHCGLRALRREAFLRMELRRDGFEFATEMVLEAARLGLRVAEVPVSYHPRTGSRSKLRSFRDGWAHLRLMVGYGLGRRGGRR